MIPPAMVGPSPRTLGPNRALAGMALDQQQQRAIKQAALHGRALRALLAGARRELAEHGRVDAALWQSIDELLDALIEALPNTPPVTVGDLVDLARRQERLDALEHDGDVPPADEGDLDQ